MSAQAAADNDLGTRPQLDETDLHIIEILRVNGRATFHDIGRHVGLSAPAAKRRFDRLISLGVIQGFSAVIDPKWLGHRAEAIVELYCNGATAPKQLMAALSNFPEIAFAATVTGDADAVVHVIARDIAHLEETLEAIRTATSVARTRSSVLLTRLLDGTTTGTGVQSLARRHA